MEEDFRGVRAEHRGRIVILFITNPGRRNAWTQAMRTDLRRHLGDLAVSDSFDGMVITGGSSDAFCAGQDLDEASSRLASNTEEWIAELRATLEAPSANPKPVVAAVRGVAAGSGMQFALACDHIVTHAAARFGQPEVKSGMASVTGSWMLQRSIGTMRMKDMVLAARFLSGTEAVTAGLANTLTSEEDVLDRAVLIAEELAALPRDAYRLTKAALAELSQASYADACELSARYQAASFDSGAPQAIRAATRAGGGPSAAGLDSGQDAAASVVVRRANS